MDLTVDVRYPPYNTNNKQYSLYEQCIKYVVRHLDIIAQLKYQYHYLRKGLTLPREICERLLEAYQEAGNDVHDGFAVLFEDREATRLKQVRLKSPSITEHGLTILLSHNLTEFEVINCRNLTEDFIFTTFVNSGENITSLSFRSSARDPLIDLSPPLPRPLKRIARQYSHKEQASVFKNYNLRKLTLNNIIFRPTGRAEGGGSRGAIVTCMRMLPSTLTHLDLSNCSEIQLSWLDQVPNLVSLVLHNVTPLHMDHIKHCLVHTHLRHLDLSHSSGTSGMVGFYESPNQVLGAIVANLPSLVSLDISETNLAGTGEPDNVSEGHGHNRDIVDIPGLRSRVGNPLEFLGLYRTHHDACRRWGIPAKCITGYASEEQLLNAMMAYMDRPEMLQKVLDDLQTIVQLQNFSNVSAATKFVLEAMDKHLSDLQIQIFGSANLHRLVYSKIKSELIDVDLKRHVISTILNGMLVYNSDETMMTNGCFTLCQFTIPDDFMFDFKRSVLLIICLLNKRYWHSRVLQRTAIYLLHCLAARVEKSEKLFIGERGAINHMLAIIKDKLDNEVYDEVLYVAWSTMWNVTDETPVNCEKFLDGNGMERFLGCYAICEGREEVLRSMMGLLGNVAEVDYLRPRLMTQRFVSVFADLLDHLTVDIEVSYNAAGVLAHMCSDGPEAWVIQQPTRDEVLRKMAIAIEKWDLTVERIINYRSFRPFIGLLRATHTPECQHWATWALANLTKVYPEKYCSVVEEDGGLQLLDEVVKSDGPYDRVKELAQMVIENCTEFKMKELRC